MRQDTTWPVQPRCNEDCQNCCKIATFVTVSALLTVATLIVLAIAQSKLDHDCGPRMNKWSPDVPQCQTDPKPEQCCPPNQNWCVECSVSEMREYQAEDGFKYGHTMLHVALVFVLLQLGFNVAAFSVNPWTRARLVPAVYASVLVAIVVLMCVFYIIIVLLAHASYTDVVWQRVYEALVWMTWIVNGSTWMCAIWDMNVPWTPWWR